MGDGCWSALEFLSDAAQLADKGTGLTDGLICLGDFIHGSLQFGGNIGTAVFAKVAVGVGIGLEIGVEFDIVELHNHFLHVR